MIKRGGLWLYITCHQSKHYGKIMFAKMIIMDELAFRFVEGEKFCAFHNTLQP